jgi:hypothetical protein
MSLRTRAMLIGLVGALGSEARAKGGENPILINANFGLLVKTIVGKDGKLVAYELLSASEGHPPGRIRARIEIPNNIADTERGIILEVVVDPTSSSLKGFLVRSRNFCPSADPPKGSERIARRTATIMSPDPTIDDFSVSVRADLLRNGYRVTSCVTPTAKSGNGSPNDARDHGRQWPRPLNGPIVGPLECIEGGRTLLLIPVIRHGRLEALEAIGAPSS